jgi:hypothetical protein
MMTPLGMSPERTGRPQTNVPTVADRTPDRVLNATADTPAPFRGGGRAASASLPNGHLAAHAGRFSTRAGPEDSVADRLRSALGLTGSPQRPRTAGLPLPWLGRPETSGSIHYAVTAIDVWGRLADRSTLRSLNWQPGLTVAVSVTRGAAVVMPHGDGRYAITREGRLRLPASIRHLSHLQAGDRLLVAACADHDLLIAYPMAALDTMVLAYHAADAGESR